MRNPFPPNTVTDEEWDAVEPGHGLGWVFSDGDYIHYIKPTSESSFICIDPDKWERVLEYASAMSQMEDLISDFCNDMGIYNAAAERAQKASSELRPGDLK